MLDITVERNGGYKQVIISEMLAKIHTGLLDEKEATQAAIDFISAAEELLPMGMDAEEELSIIREALEITK